MGWLIKQPSLYFDYSSPDWVEPYDHHLVACECGKLCEKGVGLCDNCLDVISRKMEIDLEETINDDDNRTKST